MTVKLEKIDKDRLGVKYLQFFNPLNRKKEEQLSGIFSIIGTNEFKKNNVYNTVVIQDMLYSLKDLIPEEETPFKTGFKKEYLEISKFYFKTETSSKKYEKILLSQGKIVDEDNKIVNKALEKIDEEIKKLGKLNEITSQEVTEKLVVLEKIFDGFQKEYGDEVLLKIIKNLKEYSAKQRGFIYLFYKNVPNKKETMKHLLFNGADCGPYDVPAFFRKTFPYLIKDENDPNFEVFKEIMTSPNNAFITDDAEDSQRMICMFLLTIAHKPKVFDFILDTISGKDLAWIPKLNENIFTGLFSENYYSKINPTLFFTQNQIEKMFDTIISLAKRSIKNEINSGVGYGLKSIYTTANKEGIEWLEKHNEKILLKLFEKDIAKAILKNINGGLEMIAYGQFDALLVKKENKKYVFWKIEFYTIGNEGGYGATIFEGSWQDSESWNSNYDDDNGQTTIEFKSVEKTKKERAKLLEQKKAEGFVDFYEKGE